MKEYDISEIKKNKYERRFAVVIYRERGG